MATKTMNAAKQLAWIDELPEVGTYRRFIERASELDAEIAAAEARLAGLRRDAEAFVQRSEAECRRLWTPEEIAAAKARTAK